MNPSLIGVLASTGGDWVIYGLFLCSIAALAVIFDRAVVLSREEKKFSVLRRDVLSRIDGGLSALGLWLKDQDGAAARILNTALSRSGGVPEGFEDLLLSANLEQKEILERRLLILGTLGNNAPFIGLFGTVLGVIKAFHDLAASAAGPEAVMAGLSTALIATAVGLFVAIPSVVAYNYFKKKARYILSGSESLGRLILARARRERAADRSL